MLRALMAYYRRSRATLPDLVGQLAAARARFRDAPADDKPGRSKLRQQITGIEWHVQRRLRDDPDGSATIILGMMAQTAAGTGHVRETCHYLFVRRIGARAEATLIRALDGSATDARDAIGAILFDLEVRAALEPAAHGLAPPATDPSRVPHAAHALTEIQGRIAAVEQERQAMEEKNPYIGGIVMGLGPAPPGFEKALAAANRDYEGVKKRLVGLRQAEERLRARIAIMSDDRRPTPEASTDPGSGLPPRGRSRGVAEGSGVDE